MILISAERLIELVVLVFLYVSAFQWLIGYVVQDYRDFKNQTILTNQCKWWQFVEDEYGDSNSIFFVV